MGVNEFVLGTGACGGNLVDELQFVKDFELVAISGRSGDVAVELVTDETEDEAGTGIVTEATFVEGAGVPVAFDK